jgi:nucleoside-diphosphate-sugar epimerase
MIFVTGGTGFLGRHLIPTLCRAGYSLRVLTRQPEANKWLCKYPHVEVVAGDLTSGEGLDAVQGCEYVIHAAGLFSMWNMAGDFEATNVAGTEHLLAEATRANVKRLVYVSTLAVIGNPQPQRIVDEAHPPRPADPYQASKLKAEQVIKRYHYEHDIETVILRPGAFYGPLGDYAFNRLFFTDPLRGIIMQMDGGYYRIFPVYIGDAAQGILLALTQGKSGEIYNLSGEPISHRAAFDIICKEADIHWLRLNLPGFVGINFSRFLNLLSRITRREPFWPLGLRSYVFNDWHVTSDKARRELGFTPIDFADGAKRTLAWYRAGKPDWLSELEC